MGAVSQAAIREQLDQIIDPCSEAHGTPLSIIEMGLLDKIEIDDGDVTVQMHITSPVCTMVSHFIEEVETRVGRLDGVTSVSLETDSGLQWSTAMMSEEAQALRETRKQQLVEAAANASDQNGLPERPSLEELNT